ncbi:MAG: hypothetical protein LBD44_02600 [Spirochaetaceae bacterium]|jgi:uncharacterized Fe-S cluster-containing MiaB family protein|nr:hypothetical protein [Spirochaetaceae bacterium]
MAYIFSSAALLVSIVSFFVIFFYARKRTAVDRIPPETRQEVTNIINEIDRITDRDSELIEDRVRKLKSLLEDIDRRIAVHENQLDSYKIAEDKRKKLNEEKTDAAVEAYRTLGKNMLAYKSFTPPHLTVSITENRAAADGAESANADTSIKKAAELYAAGVPVYEIAKRLHKTVDEIEIALFLSSKH